MPKVNRIVESVQPGNEYGNLTVVSVAREKRGNYIRQIATCLHEDGSTRKVRIEHLESGNSTGKHKPSVCGGKSDAHKGSYASWAKMIARCYVPTNNHYYAYGARGITVCDRWRESFAAFIADMGDRPEGCSIDRIDNNGNYEPGNVRWATPNEQASNKRSNMLLTVGDQVKTLAQWSRETGKKAGTIRHRVLAGWSHEAAIMSPVNCRKSHKRCTC